MLKRAFITVGVAAVLLTGIFPASDGCGLEASVDHACCAEMQPEPVSSCCAGIQGDNPSGDDAHNLDCTCVHPPSVNFAVAASSHVGQESDSIGDVAENSVTSTLLVPDSHRSVERRVRSHPPPPVFLLNCADLN